MPRRSVDQADKPSVRGRSADRKSTSRLSLPSKSESTLTRGSSSSRGRRNRRSISATTRSNVSGASNRRSTRGATSLRRGTTGPRGRLRGRGAGHAKVVGTIIKSRGRGIRRGRARGKGLHLQRSVDPSSGHLSSSDVHKNDDQSLLSDSAKPPRKPGRPPKSKAKEAPTDAPKSNNDEQQVEEMVHEGVDEAGEHPEGPLEASSGSDGSIFELLKSTIAMREELAKERAKRLSRSQESVKKGSASPRSSQSGLPNVDRNLFDTFSSTGSEDGYGSESTSVDTDSSKSKPGRRRSRLADNVEMSAVPPPETTSASAEAGPPTMLSTDGDSTKETEVGGQQKSTKPIKTLLNIHALKKGLLAKGRLRKGVLLKQGAAARKKSPVKGIDKIKRSPKRLRSLKLQRLRHKLKDLEDAPQDSKGVDPVADSMPGAVEITVTDPEGQVQNVDESSKPSLKSDIDVYSFKGTDDEASPLPVATTSPSQSGDLAVAMTKAAISPDAKESNTLQTNAPQTLEVPVKKKVGRPRKKRSSLKVNHSGKQLEKAAVSDAVRDPSAPADVPKEEVGDQPAEEPPLVGGENALDSSFEMSEHYEGVADDNIMLDESLHEDVSDPELPFEFTDSDNEKDDGDGIQSASEKTLVDADGEESLTSMEVSHQNESDTKPLSEKDGTGTEGAEGMSEDITMNEESSIAHNEPASSVPENGVSDVPEQTVKKGFRGRAKNLGIRRRGKSWTHKKRKSAPPALHPRREELGWGHAKQREVRKSIHLGDGDSLRKQPRREAKGITTTSDANVSESLPEKPRESKPAKSSRVWNMSHLKNWYNRGSKKKQLDDGSATAPKAVSSGSGNVTEIKANVCSESEHTECEDASLHTDSRSPPVCVEATLDSAREGGLVGKLGPSSPSSTSDSAIVTSGDPAKTHSNLDASGSSAVAINNAGFDSTSFDGVAPTESLTADEMPDTKTDENTHVSPVEETEGQSQVSIAASHKPSKRVLKMEDRTEAEIKKLKSERVKRYNCWARTGKKSSRRQKKGHPVVVKTEPITDNMDSSAYETCDSTLESSGFLEDLNSEPRENSESKLKEVASLKADFPSGSKSRKRSSVGIDANTPVPALEKHLPTRRTRRSARMQASSVENTIQTPVSATRDVKEVELEGIPVSQAPVVSEVSEMSRDVLQANESRDETQLEEIKSDDSSSSIKKSESSVLLGQESSSLPCPAESSMETGDGGNLQIMPSSCSEDSVMLDDSSKPEVNDRAPLENGKGKESEERNVAGADAREQSGHESGDAIATGDELDVPRVHKGDEGNVAKEPAVIAASPLPGESSIQETAGEIMKKDDHLTEGSLGEDVSSHERCVRQVTGETPENHSVDKTMLTDQALHQSVGGKLSSRKGIVLAEEQMACPGEVNDSLPANGTALDADLLVEQKPQGSVQPVPTNMSPIQTRKSSENVAVVDKSGATSPKRPKRKSGDHSALEERTSKIEDSSPRSPDIRSKSPKKIKSPIKQMKTRGKKNKYWYLFAKTTSRSRKKDADNLLSRPEGALMPEQALPEQITCDTDSVTASCSTPAESPKSKTKLCHEPSLVKSSEPALYAQCNPCKVILVDFIKCLDLVQLQESQTAKSPVATSPRAGDASLCERIQNWEAEISPNSNKLRLHRGTSREDESAKRAKKVMSLPKGAYEEQFLNFIEDKSRVPPKPHSQKTTVLKVASGKGGKKIKLDVNKDADSPGSKKSSSTLRNYEKFRCLHCSYMASSRFTMVEHIYNHTNIVPFSCGHCGAIFGTRSGVNAHSKKEHKDAPPLLIKKVTGIKEEQHYTTTSEFEKRAGQMVPPPLPGHTITDATKSFFESSLPEKAKKSPTAVKHSSKEHAQLKLQLALNAAAEKLSRKQDEKDQEEKKKFSKSNEKSRLLLGDGADPSQPYYQCKHCTYSSNFKNSIEQHISEKHPDDRELICSYCKISLAKGDSLIVKHFQTKHPDEQIAVQFAVDYTKVQSDQLKGCDTAPHSEEINQLPSTTAVTSVASSHPTILNSLLSAPTQKDVQPMVKPSSKRTARKSFSPLKKAQSLAAKSRSSEKATERSEEHPPIILRVPRYLLQEAEARMNATESNECNNTSVEISETPVPVIIQPESDAVQDDVVSTEEASADSAVCSDAPTEESTERNDDAEEGDSSPLPFKISSIVSLAGETDPDKRVDKTPPPVSQQFFCNFCDFSTEEKVYMISHLDSVHKIAYHFICPHCPPTADKLKNSMMSHLQKYHPEEIHSQTYSIIDEAKYFKAKEVTETGPEPLSSEEDVMFVGADKGSLLKTKPRPAVRPVSMVGPMVAGQALQTIRPQGSAAEIVNDEVKSRVRQKADEEGRVAPEPPAVLQVPSTAPTRISPPFTAPVTVLPARLMAPTLSSRPEPSPNARAPPKRPTVSVPPPPLIPGGIRPPVHQQMKLSQAPPLLIRAPTSIKQAKPAPPQPAAAACVEAIAPIVVAPIPPSQEEAMMQQRPTIIQPVQPRPQSKPHPDLENEEAARKAFSVFNLTPSMRLPRPPLCAPPPIEVMPTRPEVVMPIGMPRVAAPPCLPPANPFIQSVPRPQRRKQDPLPPELEKFKQFQIPRRPSPTVSKAIRSSMPPHMFINPRLSAPPRVGDLAPPVTTSSKSHCCLYCPAVAPNKQELHDHILTHGPGIGWTCPYCPTANQMTKNFLEKHILTQHPGQEIAYVPFGL